MVESIAAGAVFAALCIWGAWRAVTPPTAESMAAKQLAEGRRQLLEHEAQAEYHEAMTVMYRSRVERLEGPRVSYNPIEVMTMAETYKRPFPPIHDPIAPDLQTR